MNLVNSATSDGNTYFSFILSEAQLTFQILTNRRNYPKGSLKFFKELRQIEVNKLPNQYRRKVTRL